MELGRDSCLQLYRLAKIYPMLNERGWIFNPLITLKNETNT